MRLHPNVKTGVTALVLLASIASFTGCGAGSRTGEKGAASVECEFTAPDSDATVNVLAYNSSSIDPFTNTMVKSCSKDNVTLKHDPIDFGGQVTKTTATLAGDKGSYDILESYSFIVPSLAAGGGIEPLDDYVAKYSEKYKLGDLAQGMKSAMSYDGKLYGLPMQAQMFIMAYREDVFEDLNLEVPKTFEEMIEAAKVIQAEGDMQYPIALPLNATEDIIVSYQAAMNSNGTDFLDENGKPQFESDASKKALESLKSLKSYMNPEVTTFDQPKVQQQMFNGTAAMSIMFSGRMNDLTLPVNSKLSEKFAFAAPPQVSADSNYLYSRLSVDGWSIPTNTDLDKDMLFQMMAASVSEDASKASVPAAYPAREGIVKDDSSKYALAANETASATMPASGNPHIATVSNAIRPTLVKAFTGQLEIAAAMKEMQNIAEKSIADSK